MKNLKAKKAIVKIRKVISIMFAKNPITLLALSFLLFSGCTQSTPKENINVVAINYMNQKYGDNCEYFGPYGDSMTGTHQLMISCDRYPGQNVLVAIKNYKDEENRIFLDNYLAVKYHNDTENFLKECAEQVFTEANVFSEVVKLPLPAELSVDTSFEEYISDTTVPLDFLVEVDVNNFSSREQVQELINLLSKYGSEFYLSVLVVDSNEYGSDSSDVLDDKMYRRNYIHCAKFNTHSKDSNIRWLEDED